MFYPQREKTLSDYVAELDDSIDRSGTLAEPTPYQEVRDYFHFTNNCVPELDEQAKQLASSLDASVRDQFKALTKELCSFSIYSKFV